MNADDKQTAEINESQRAAGGGPPAEMGYGSRSHSSFDIEISTGQADAVRADCIVVTVDNAGELSAAAQLLDARIGGKLSHLVARGSVSGEAGSALLLLVFEHLEVSAVLLLGSGNPETRDRAVFRRMLGAAHREIARFPFCDIALYLVDTTVPEADRYWQLRDQIAVFEELAYRYPRDSGDRPERQRRRLLVSGRKSDQRALDHGRGIARAVTTTRCLADTPPNLCTPTFLADFASGCGEANERIRIEVLDEPRIEALGMNALLSVGQGSAEPTKLVVMHYNGSAAEEPPVVLIGKGVTFDTGGTSIKSREGMKLMKYDMCGAAAVIGVFDAVAELELPINVVAIAVCAENMPGRDATRPSDVVRTMSGRTVEVLNPDAEGRLLLCDALTFAQQFNPAVVIDVATLTGASLVALGRHYSAMFANRNELANELVSAGMQAQDKVWQLPLSEEDLPQLESQFADIANIGDGTAGCVVAALFLSTFAGSQSWAHLDVSGTAKRHGETVGATGRPAALLLQFLLSRAEANAP